MANSYPLLAAATILLLPLFLPRVFLAVALIVGGLITWLSSDQGGKHNGNVHAAKDEGSKDNAVQPLHREAQSSIESGDSSTLTETPLVQSSPEAEPTLPTQPATEKSQTAVPSRPKAVGGAAILSKLRAARAEKARAGKPQPVTVLYASQTGTAQDISQSIGGHCRDRLGLEAKVASLDEFGLDALTSSACPILIVVASSTGDGDPPDNGTRFYGQIKKRGLSPEKFKGIQCTVLGLGDSNYTQFCRVPRTLRTHLLASGATEFYPGRDVDEVDGLESIVETWLEGLWPVLKSICFPAGVTEKDDTKQPLSNRDAEPAPLPACRVAIRWVNDKHSENLDAKSQKLCTKSIVEMPVSKEEESGLYSAEDPFYARLASARWLTTPQAGDRKVLHCEFDVRGSGARFHPGDSIGVKPCNPPKMVDDLIHALGLEAERVFDLLQAATGETPTSQTQAVLLPHIPMPCTVRRALSEGVDITSPPRKGLLRLLAEYCETEQDKATLLRWTTRAGKAEYSREILEEKPSLLDLVRRFRARPPLAALLDALPVLSSRLYSITNYAETPDKACIALSIVRFERPSGAIHEGVASTWLERMATARMQETTMKDPDGGNDAIASGRLLHQPVVPVYFRSGGAFRPPSSLEAPVIMIGPGTGVAPFLGFLEERRTRKSALLSSRSASMHIGPAWLFFGCRHPDHDYLYREELEEYCGDGTLDRLVVAFSRTQEHKVYVQNRILELASEVADLLVIPNAAVFVCGDGMQMAAGVHEALCQVFDDRLGEGQGAGAMAAMVQEGRYVQDIWS